MPYPIWQMMAAASGPALWMHHFPRALETFLPCSYADLLCDLGKRHTSLGLCCLIYTKLCLLRADCVLSTGSELSLSVPTVLQSWTRRHGEGENLALVCGVAVAETASEPGLGWTSPGFASAQTSFPSSPLCPFGAGHGFCSSCK